MRKMTSLSQYPLSDRQRAKKPIPAWTSRATTSSSLVPSCTCSGKLSNAIPLTKLTSRFRRVIADEFTYLDKRALAALLRLTSCYKWVLSGTPPVSDFPAIRR
jgi:hypothetical protein